MTDICLAMVAFQICLLNISVGMAAGRIASALERMDARHAWRDAEEK